MAFPTRCGCWFQHPTHPMCQPRRSFLPLTGFESKTTILATTARTTLTQTFVNCSGSSQAELQYSFPLYYGVSIVSFRCRIGERTIFGIVKERQEAKRQFTEAVKRGWQAGLLEQLLETADVFTTKLGNVAKGEKLIVEIVYLDDLKQDAETDGVRFVVPARIAPRYGELSTSSADAMSSTSKPSSSGTMRFLVDVSMGSGAIIRGVRSPSHPIAVTMGRNSTDEEEVFENHLASATLASSDLALDNDFVVIVNVKGHDVPRALLETHPTQANHRALMTTLVPKFNLPNAHPEIVFVIDRSGSMEGKINLLQQALRVFLKSLPVSVKFNICSFGSSHSFLFRKSRPYDEDSLEEALAYVNTVSANFGGTEIYEPLNSCVKQRLAKTSLELMVMTDGEIWAQAELFKLINSVVADKVRVFSLGIGSGASTSLVEGMARAGNGFAQFVQDGEPMDKRVVRMLKAALMPYISDYAIQVKYAPGTMSDKTNKDDDFEIIESFSKSMKTVVQDVKAKKGDSVISLFTSGFKESKPRPFSVGKYDHLPKVSVPKVLQAPHVIPQFYAFNRTTVYLILGPSSDQRQPQSVILTGTSEHGPLRLEIPIQDVGVGETIHQLAAKRAVQDLEEGRGWITAAITSTGKMLQKEHEADWERIVEREAVRLGTQFQVGSRSCSFVALEGNPDTPDGAKPVSTLSEKQAGSAPAAAPGALSACAMHAPHTDEGLDNQDLELFEEPYDPTIEDTSAYDPTTMDGHSPPYYSGRSRLPPAYGSSAGGTTQSFGGGDGGGGLMSTSRGTAPMPTRAKRKSMFRAMRRPTSESLFGGKFGRMSSSTAVSLSSAPASAPAPAPVSGSVSAPAPAPAFQSTALKVQSGLFDGTGSQSLNDSESSEPLLYRIINLQEFNGGWKKVAELLALVHVSSNIFQAALPSIRNDESVKATALAVAWLEMKASADRDVWDMVADKARSWMARQPGCDDVDDLIEQARNAFFQP